MKILLLHAKDSLDNGPWASQPWDRMVDLATAGASAYQRWSDQFGCPSGPLNSWSDEGALLREVRDLLAAGLGCLEDSEGLDWWELTAIMMHQQIESLILLRRFSSTLGPQDEVFVTRPGFHADVLRQWLGSRVRTFMPQIKPDHKGVQHYLRVMQTFSWPQLAEIFWDKYDPGHQVRSRFSWPRRPSAKPVVLLPTAYVNVSQTLLAYARVLPSARFLLVATRRSGAVKHPPAGTATARLSSYASKDGSKEELCVLLAKWEDLRKKLRAREEIAILERLGHLDNFSTRIRQGLQIRNAWRRVFELEPVKAVICGDDSNPSTHIPLLLAKSRGLPTLACHHGALDGRYWIKRNHADVVLVKGRMEQDYVVNVCGLPAAAVEIGAPAAAPLAAKTQVRLDDFRPLITFFSEPYEVSSGRARDFYRDVLPPLAELAARSGRKLVVKLHPFESKHERRRLVAEVLPPALRRLTTVVSGPLTEELLRRSWFGITVLSTVAMECALLGIPCFLCQWLEFTPYGYIQQYGRFGAGYVLKSAAEMAAIPRILESYVVGPEVPGKLWQPISASRLNELLGDRVNHPVAS